MDILLSVKPVYVNFMRLGQKTVELRKKMRLEGVGRVYVYESSPVKKITGFFNPIKIIKNPIDLLWQETCQFSCLEKENFFDYYKGHEYGVAIFFNQFSRIKPLTLDILPASAPQSYLILNQEQTEHLWQHLTYEQGDRS